MSKKFTFTELAKVQRPQTRNQVVRYLAEQGITAELHRGKGYFYFGGDASDWYTSSVLVLRVSDLTFEGWLESYRSLKQQA